MSRRTRLAGALLALATAVASAAPPAVQVLPEDCGRAARVPFDIQSRALPPD
ncbi:hypothetical protein [Variovorax sp. AFSI2.2]|uniref:hypothetical protein n=1 Tax=Variovorax sp. AFSI2.2 TaxID=3384160 RepID=UPI003EB92A7F